MLRRITTKRHRPGRRQGAGHVEFVLVLAMAAVAIAVFSTAWYLDAGALN